VMPAPSNPINTKMKVEFADITETRKRLTVEIPSDQSMPSSTGSLRAWLVRPRSRVPSGKVPFAVVRQRFKDDILHDIAEAWSARLDEALDERTLDPVDTPDVRTSWSNREGR